VPEDTAELALIWDRPQPPVGDAAHRYFFRLYALRSPTGLGHGFVAGDLR
jgi:phosphatidylethanolamine-binding protein (PEBP) family uncharacterized protein